MMKEYPGIPDRPNRAGLIAKWLRGGNWAVYRNGVRVATFKTETEAREFIATA